MSEYIKFEDVNNGSCKAFVGGQLYGMFILDEDQGVWIMHPENTDNNVIYTENLLESQSLFSSSF